MLKVRIAVTCPCGEVSTLEFNTLTMEHRVLPPLNKATYRELWEVVVYYKATKGFDKISTWDYSFKPRALKAAKKLLYFLRNFPDPVSLAKEIIDDLEREAAKSGFAWTLETVHSRAPEFVARKQRGGK